MTEQRKARILEIELENGKGGKRTYDIIISASEVHSEIDMRKLYIYPNDRYSPVFQLKMSAQKYTWSIKYLDLDIDVIK